MKPIAGNPPDPWIRRPNVRRLRTVIIAFLSHKF